MPLRGVQLTGQLTPLAEGPDSEGNLAAFAPPAAAAAAAGGIGDPQQQQPRVRPKSAGTTAASAGRGGGGAQGGVGWHEEGVVDLEIEAQLRQLVEVLPAGIREQVRGLRGLGVVGPGRVFGGQVGLWLCGWCPACAHGGSLECSGYPVNITLQRQHCASRLQPNPLSALSFCCRCCCCRWPGSILSRRGSSCCRHVRSMMPALPATDSNGQQRRYCTKLSQQLQVKPHK